MKKALILTWTGFQDHEVVYPYHRLIGAGFSVEIVADKKDEKGCAYGIFGLNMPCHVLIEDFKKNIEKYHKEYDVIVLPGGVKSLEKLRQEREVCEFINKWDEEGKLIISTCHGAQLLISSKVTDDISNSGATYVNEPYVIDRNIISSPHYDHMGPWMEAALDLYGKINA